MRKLEKYEKVKEEVIPMSAMFNHIPPRDLEEIMEWLSDGDFLSKRGMRFRHYFWEMFIKESK